MSSVSSMPTDMFTSCIFACACGLRVCVSHMVSFVDVPRGCSDPWHYMTMCSHDYCTGCMIISTTYVSTTRKPAMTVQLHLWLFVVLHVKLWNVGCWNDCVYQVKLWTVGCCIIWLWLWLSLLFIIVMIIISSSSSSSSGSSSSNPMNYMTMCSHDPWLPLRLCAWWCVGTTGTQICESGGITATTITKHNIYWIHRRANGRFTESPKSRNVCGQMRQR